MPRQRTLRVLGIETSCDETAAAVVIVRRESSGVSREEPNTHLSFTFDVQSNVVASQVKIHAKYGGVVPEVAAREHVTAILPVIQEAIACGLKNGERKNGEFDQSGCTPSSSSLVLQSDHSSPFFSSSVLRTAVDAVAVTAGPGLITSLSVGAEIARTLAYAWKKPLIGVNHIEGHVLSSLLSEARGNPKPETRNPKQILNSNDRNSKFAFPALALIVSGGHTELLLMRGWGKYECIGATRDDAAGEAFDKVGKLLGLPYPGGPAVAKAAEGGDPKAFNFPRGMLHSKDYEFSFSGLKTAVRYFVTEMQNAKCKMQNCTWMSQGNHSSFCVHHSAFLRDVCASFQQAVVDVLVAKTTAAAQRYRVKTILLGGGVAANKLLREQLGAAIQSHIPDTEYRIPNTEYTGDNAAMIAAAGGVRLLLGERTPWQELDVDANWELGRSSPSHERAHAMRSRFVH